MTRLAFRAMVGWGALAALAAWALGATAEEQFESVYGKDYRAAVMSRETTDDISLAETLLSAARSAAPELKEILCEKAFLLAQKDPSGWATAVAAMDLLAETVPQRKIECLEKVAAIRQNAFDAAKGTAWNETGEALVRTLLALGRLKLEAEDVTGARGCAVRAKATAEKIRSPQLGEVETLAALVEVHARLLPLKQAIKVNPANRDAREKLMKIYLIELDDPAAAAKFVEQNRDDNLDKYILVAAMNPANVPERGLIELGNWYRSLAEEAGPAGKAAMLRRAQTYYRQYLEVHTDADEERSKAELAAKQVAETLAAMEAAAAPPEPQWVDLLKLANPSRHALGGKWAPKANGLGVSPFPDAYLAVPALPEGNYELQVGFTRIAGANRGVIVALPVGNRMALLRLGAEMFSFYDYPGFSVSGLESVRGAPFSSNPTTRRPANIVAGQRHLLDIAVTTEGADAEVTIKLDNQNYIHWKGPQSDLTCPPLGNRKQPPKAFGLGADRSTVVFDGMRVRMMTGQLKRL